MHWNIKGEADRYGDKAELILIPILLPLLVYVIFLVVPRIDLKWEGSAAKAMKILYAKETYLIEEITDGKTLYNESLFLNHCVYSYLENCVSGFVSVWGLRKQINGVFVTQVTIEVRGCNIVQAVGYRNRAINNAEMEVISIWAAKMRYEVNIETVLLAQA